MKNICKFFLPVLMLLSCSKTPADSVSIPDQSPDGEVSHEMIVLGEKMEDPYAVENVRRAYTMLYPTKSARNDVRPTDLYVRFLPENEAQYQALVATGIYILDHPVDYRILKEGDYYQDPAVAEDAITWQYAVVSKDFAFPEGIRYELLDECYLAEHDPATRAPGCDVDWDAVERAAYEITGNADLLLPATKADGTPVTGTPTGRITIVDKDYAGGKPFGVAGVMVSCNSFVKFTHAYTDRDGYYTMPKSFKANPRYRLVFHNELGFSIGFNLVLIPGSISTLGKGTAEGLSAQITTESNGSLFRRCAVNNAAYDYYTRCGESDMNITAPPSDIRFWIFKEMNSSSASMLHHGAFLDNNLFSKYLGQYAALIKTFLPDITIGCAGVNDYSLIYRSVTHELSHASHFAQVGKTFWNPYITYIIMSWVSGSSCYGDGSDVDAGYCEVGEMWAYYMESKMYQDRYGGSMPTFGTSYWFYPQIFRYLDERGFPRSYIFKALTSEVNSRQALQKKLLELYPSRQSLINQVFERYAD